MKQLLFILGAIFILGGCQREDDIHTNVANISPIEVTVFSSVVGIVTDDSGYVVNGASVYLGDYQTESNEFGRFEFKNILIPKDGAFVQIEKQGYFKGSRSFSTSLEETPYVKIELLSQELVDVVNTNQGGQVQFQNSVVDLPQGEYELQNGSKYSGEVYVYAQYLDPTKQETFQQMPGELVGLTEQGEIQALESYGMMGVELTNGSGEYLDLPEGTVAEIRLKVPNSILGSAPTTIPLWHFDEIKGIWVEEGQATLLGDTYVGQVKHFSFWNCDEPFDFVELNGFVEIDSEPYVGGTIKITDLTSGAVRYGVTGERGFFSGKVPKDRDLLLEVLNFCGGVIYNQTLGSLVDDLDVGVVNVESQSESVTIAGYFDNCLQEDIMDAYVVVYGNGVYQTIPVQADGSFSTEISGCSGLNNIEIYGIDETNGLISGAVVLDDLSNLYLTACDDFDLFNYEIFYEGQNWNPAFYGDSTAVTHKEMFMISSTEQLINFTIIDPLVYEEEDGVQCNGVFEVNLLTDEVNYQMVFESQGFMISGTCQRNMIDVGPFILEAFMDFNDEITVLDPLKYPEEATEVTFQILL